MSLSPSATPAAITLFSELDLPPNVEKGVRDLGFERPTPIQARAIPIALTRRDIIGVAQTGTGKTAAFTIPILTRLATMPGKTALVLAPTRELALQIEEFWTRLAKHSPGMHSAILIGGVAMSPQIRALSRKPRLIVATPGRLCDHLQRRTIDLRATEILVLDEADRMLDMGFAPQLNQIVRSIPTDRQTLFFTATWTSETDGLARKYLRNPEKVTIGTVSTAITKIEQTIVKVSTQAKNEALLDELNVREGTALVFARTQSRTDRLAKFLLSYGVEVRRIHGGRSQGQRVAALEAFRSGKIRVLVATDIAARGIDVTEIGHVINYDLPMVPEDYIHRIGRTGRNGATGEAISFVTPEDRKLWDEIYRLLKRGGTAVRLADRAPTPENRPAPVELPKAERQGNGHGNGGRRNEPRGGGRSGNFSRRGGPRSENRFSRGNDRRDSESAPRSSGGGIQILNDPFRPRPITGIIS